MNCQRCSSTCGGIASARIRSELLDLNVCDRCAKEAIKLGLLVEPLYHDGSDGELASLSVAA